MNFIYANYAEYMIYYREWLKIVWNPYHFNYLDHDNQIGKYERVHHWTLHNSQIIIRKYVSCVLVVINYHKQITVWTLSYELL